MIPLHKLERLPRSQRLRKTAKIMAEAEFRSVSRDWHPGWSELDYLVSIAKMLSKDEEFLVPAKISLLEAANELSSAFSEGGQTGRTGLPRRPLNTIRHIVNSEIGIQIADWDLIDDEGELSREDRLVFAGVHIFLEDIRSPYNVGSIFRTAESFGVEKIFTSPHCASPSHPRALRSAMGCVDLVPWEAGNFNGLSGTLFALETGGTPIDDFLFPESGVMIVGSEELGVSPAALAAADRSAGRVTIPTYGAKGSLNVAVAFGIVMRAWAKSLVNEAGPSPV